MRDLTEKQAEVLGFIERYFATEQSMPTRAEIAEFFGWASPNSAQEYINVLVKKGALFTRPGRARGIRLV